MRRIFYTDGSCCGNPGPGGFGVVELSVCYRQTMLEYIPSYSMNYAYNEQCENTTNNREEMKAVIHVLEMAANDSENEYIIYSDSAYVVNMCNDWIWKWAKNNWKNSKKKDVENIDLVKQIYNYLSSDFFNAEIKKVKGHHGMLGNDLADAYATNNMSKKDKLMKDFSIL